MKINEPIFIRKGQRGYQITGTIPGYGRVRRYGRTEEEAKEKFFEACERPNTHLTTSRDKALATVLFAALVAGVMGGSEEAREDGLGGKGKKSVA